MVTPVPSCALDPPAGLCEHTMPEGLSQGWDFTMAVKFAFASVFTASSCFIPTTSGTVPLFGGGGAGKLFTGRPATALVMSACQIGAAMVPPHALAPPWTGG